MSLPPLSVREFESVPIGYDGEAAAVSAEEADLLSLIDGQRRGFCERGYRSVRFAAYCGLIPLGSRSVEILPKIGSDSVAESRFSFINLLAHAGTIPLTELESVRHGLHEHDLLEVFIRAFLESVRDLVRYGLVRTYSGASEDLCVVRGKINLQRQCGQLANRPDVVACHFDEVGGDNANNRLIKAALRACRRWIGADDLARLWVEEYHAFADVSDGRPTDRELAALARDRRFARYGSCLSWASLILTFQTPSLRSGAFKSPGILFNMNLLFQEAVGEFMARSLDRSGGQELSRQDRSMSFAPAVGAPSGSGFDLKPDSVLTKSHRVVAVADAKWKEIKLDSKGRLLPILDDLYQLHAYASAYDCSDVALVYPWHRGLLGSTESTREFPSMGGNSRRVHIVCVDVSTNQLTAKCGGGQFGALLAVACR